VLGGVDLALPHPGGHRGGGYGIDASRTQGLSEALQGLLSTFALF